MFDCVFYNVRKIDNFIYVMNSPVEL